MAQIFISYSRADSQFVDGFTHQLERARYDFWYDDDIHGGADWWKTILRQINRCEIFVYLLSNDSLTSSYCRAEMKEAIRLNKRILPIIVRPKTDLVNAGDLTPILRDIQYIDLAKGVRDGEAMASVFGALNELMQEARQINQHPAQNITIGGNVSGAVVNIGGTVYHYGDVQLDYQRPIDEPPVADKPAPKAWYQRTEIVMPLIVVVIGGVFGLWQGVFANRPDRTPTAAAINPTETPSFTPLPATTAAPTLTPLPTETPSFTPRPEGEGQGVRATATLSGFQQLQTAEAQLIGATETAAYATLFALSATPTPTNTPILPTPTPLPPTNTPDPVDLTRTPITRNADWTPVERDFDGVTMVLVPAGCFMMGSNDYSDEQPVHEQCFDEPFWIDKYEVTNAQYGSVGCHDWSSEPDQPRNCVTWFEARDFCESRGMRLPTEREWEYAARGPDNLTYPWGNEFVSENAIWNRSSSQGTANVGSIEAGKSWVGAYDMSGNVWEWTSSLYAGYPYGEDHESNKDVNSSRVLRGGSWYGSNAYFLRSADRGYGSPVVTYDDRGFRCARLN